MTLVSMHGVHKVFGEGTMASRALGGVDLEIGEGEWWRHWR